MKADLVFLLRVTHDPAGSGGILCTLATMVLGERVQQLGSTLLSFLSWGLAAWSDLVLSLWTQATLLLSLLCAGTTGTYHMIFPASAGDGTQGLCLHRPLSYTPTSPLLLLFLMPALGM